MSVGVCVSCVCFVVVAFGVRVRGTVKPRCRYSQPGGKRRGCLFSPLGLCVCVHVL